MENSSPAENSLQLLQLDPSDNVGVLTQSFTAGTCLRVNRRDISLDAPMGLGHKLALRDIGAGEKILKYGCAIGSAVTDIATGEHVHLHNIKSDYLPTHTLDQGQKYDR